MKKFLVIGLILTSLSATAQNFQEKFDEFKKQNQTQYDSFRKEANSKYSEFLRKAWDEYSAIAPVPRPKEPAPIPPQPYVEPVIEEPIKEEPIIKEPVIDEPINVEPVIEEPIIKEPVIEEPVIEEKEEVVPAPRPVIPLYIPPILPEPQPVPVVPIKEKIIPNEQFFSFDFYGARPKVRLPKTDLIKLSSNSNDEIADAWETLSNGNLDNLIRDCLKIRIENKLCDWAYLQMLDNLAQSIYGETDEATLLLSWLFSQSGYQMRLGKTDDRLVMLFGSKHLIYDRSSYSLDGNSFYPYNSTSSRMNIAQVEFPGETPLSLFINSEPMTGLIMTDERTIQSKKYPNMRILSQVKSPLIEFFDTYPTSAIGGNMMSRWAMYANTPLSQETKNIIYPAMKAELDSLSPLDATQRILNWIQTGLEYGYDDEIWGGDRAFFAEETLYYPYCDCEDRSILFSRLVRDLVGLDVALIYYPGHLATAVRFPENVSGSKVQINGADFTICDPTYIGAPVGKQMPGVNSANIQAILLED